MADEIEKRSNGRVKFERYWGGSLVTAGEELSNLQNGILDMTWIHNRYYSDMYLTSWAWNVPFQTSDPYVYEDVTAALWNQFPEMRNELEKNNIKVWPEFCWGSYDVITKFPFQTLSDLKGHKVNFSGDAGDWARALGADTTTMVMSEIFQNLQTGVCEGGNWPASMMLSYNFHDAGCKYVTYCHMGCRTGGYPAINQKFWDSLPADIQQIFDEVITEGRTKSAEVALEKIAQYKEVGEANGVTFYELSDEDIAEWSELCQPFVEAWIEELDGYGYDGEAFVKAIQDYCEQYGDPMRYLYVK